MKLVSQHRSQHSLQHRSQRLAQAVVVACRVALVGVAGGAVIGSTGCESIRTVKVPSSSTVQVPGQGVLAGNPLAKEQMFPSDAISEALAKSISQEFDTAGYEKDAVDSLKLTELTMTVTEPNEGNTQVRGLGFLEKLSINVSAEGVDPVLVAESGADDFDGDPGPVSYEMPLTDAELVEAFQAGDALLMDADIQPGDPPQFETEVKFDTELTIIVNVVGAVF